MKCDALDLSGEPCSSPCKHHITFRASLYNTSHFVDIRRRSSLLPRQARAAYRAANDDRYSRHFVPTSFPSPKRATLNWVKNRSLILGTNYLELVLICPQNGTAFLTGFTADVQRSSSSRQPITYIDAAIYL